MRKLFSILMALVAIIMVVGCNAGNTSEGDLQSAAEERQVGKDPNAPKTQE